MKAIINEYKCTQCGQHFQDVCNPECELTICPYCDSEALISRVAIATMDYCLLLPY